MSQPKVIRLKKIAGYSILILIAVVFVFMYCFAIYKDGFIQGFIMPMLICGGFVGILILALWLISANKEDDKSPDEVLINSIQELIEDNYKWAKETFPDATTIGIARHLIKEVEEVIQALETQQMTAEGGPTLMECADAWLLYGQLLKRTGFTFEEVLRAAKNKMKINRKRTWIQNNQGFAEHKR